MTAILFGSISTLADTSELQRQAFNEAFVAHGLEWHWSRQEYTSMLSASGGARRIADYAAARGEDVDATAIHATKSAVFQEFLETRDVAPRPGVARTIELAKEDGHKLALVTTTAPENIKALLGALEPYLDVEAFELIVDSSSVADPKPSPAAYIFALDQLDENAGDTLAIEDNVEGVKAAVDAGIACVAFPNENTVGATFGGAVEVFTEAIEPGRISELILS